MQVKRLLNVGVRVGAGRVRGRQNLAAIKAEFGQVNQRRCKKPTRLGEVRSAGDRAGEVKDVGVDPTVDELVRRLLGQLELP